MNPKPLKNPTIMMKRTAILLSLVTFIAGFLAGTVVTVLKTTPIPGDLAVKGQADDYAQKAKMLEAYVAQNPDDTFAWIQLGHVFFDTDQFTRAIGAYEKALEQDPKNVDVLTDLGVMYRRNGQPRKAIEKFDEAIAADPKHETARLNKGIVLMHDLKDRQSAIKTWEKLLEINPLAMANEDQSLDQLIKHYKEGHDKK
ncbi:MAG: tetratricopeptide repeat protein [Deltaproteobacteria bacterium]|nr:tetratricopeptide repeat protein [Deltaproteobacteria bacterium]